MPRIKKATATDNVEIVPIASQQENFSLMTPISTSDNKDPLINKKNKKEVTNDIILDIQAPLAKLSKKDFKQLHIKGTYWLENDIYQTITDMTEGKKVAKALLINQALKDYLQKNKIEIKPLRVKGNKD